MEFFPPQKLSHHPDMDLKAKARQGTAPFAWTTLRMPSKSTEVSQIVLRVVDISLRSELNFLAPLRDYGYARLLGGRTDFRNTVPRFSPENRKAKMAMVDFVKRIATEKQVRPAQVALAWLLARQPWIVPIPGTTKLHRLEENLGAVNVQLTPDDLREIEQASSQIEIHGDRYSAANLATIDR
ncbi:MAG: aldo/keto reductase [Acidobacteriaceae bacterium]|nr:aldo/keto reductase [Acidobacteriaceae bacterium]